MTWNEFVYSIGDVFYATFEILKMGGNAVNYLLAAIIFGLLVLWLKVMAKMFKENDAKGEIR